MSSEPTVPQESAIVEVTPQTTDIVVSHETTDLVVSPQTTEMVEKEMPPNTPADVINETAALFEAIQKRTQAEVQAAGDLTRETYQNAIHKAREAIEQNQQVAKEQMDKAVQLIQQEAERNWLVVDAIRTRAQSQIQSAGEMTLENYLKAVRQAREAVEQNQLIERSRIEQAAQQIQQQAEKNWLAIASEIESLGVRLADAAKNAWNALMQSR